MTLNFSKPVYIFFSLVVIIFIVYSLLCNYEYSDNWVLLTKKNDVKEVNSFLIKYILIWDEYWKLPQRYDELFEDGSEIFQNCLISNCFMTRNKSLVPMEDFDAILFHGMHYDENPENKPPKRRYEQVYIYFNLETPFNTPKYLEYSKKNFNWTMSYRYVLFK